MADQRLILIATEVIKQKKNKTLKTTLLKLKQMKGWYNSYMFKDDPNIIKLDEGIFWYKNFLSKEEVEVINKRTLELNLGTHWFDQIEFKVTSAMPELVPVWNKISEFLAPEYVIHPMASMLYFGEGKQMLPHCDSPGEDMTEALTVPDVWATCCVLSWGACVYFGEFTGGQIYYPNQGIDIAVQPGDLVIHSALTSHEHGVRPVESGVRYTFSNFSLKPEKNPGSFYNYGTKENEERQKNVDQWLQPLFKNEKSVIMPELIQYK